MHMLLIAVYNNKLSKSDSKMFCDNVSYETERLKNNCSKYCSLNQGQNLPPSYNFLPTEQSERNPSNLYNQKITGRQSQYPNNHKLPHIKQIEAFQLMNQNTKRQNKKLQAVQRNNKICAILSTVLAFSQRIQVLKEKLCGYPAQNFSPVQFFNVLDITEKGHVDLYDIKRFVNNEKIREKDIIALFKKVNGDHAKDNTRLTYFGYLNLIKPYFNEQLARDLLLRDTNVTKRTNKSKQSSLSSRIDNEMIEPTQQSVLLLFQELILLYCICTTEHEQVKQTLMNEYMLNTVQIKQIIGLDQSDLFQNSHTLDQSNNSLPKTRHKSPLSIFFEFIQNNSQFQIEFQEMKFLLAFLGVHQFSLTNDKYLSVLFLPTNCKAEILQQIKKNREENIDVEGAQNYMNTYLTKQNLMNKGNIKMIREYLDQKQKANLSQEHIGRTSAPYKANFLQFVHPRSLNRIDQNNVIPSSYQLPNSYQPQRVETSYPSSQHPHFQINASNKQLTQNQRVSFMQPQIDPTQRQYSNSSSIPQENIRVNAPRQTLIRQDYGYHAGLNNEFYGEGHKDLQDQGNTSDLSNTPFLEKFMKIDNNAKRDKKYSQETYFKKNNQNQDNSKINSSKISDSAFQVVDYGYELHQGDERNYQSSRKPVVKKYVDESQRFKKQSLDSRYNLVVNQYKSSNLYGQDAKKIMRNKEEGNKLYQINEQQSYSIKSGVGSIGPKFEKSNKVNHLGIANPVLDYSRGNYINSVGLSQSNMVNESNFMNRFYQNGGNILNEFLKK